MLYVITQSSFFILRLLCMVVTYFYNLSNSNKLVTHSHTPGFWDNMLPQVNSTINKKCIRRLSNFRSVCFCTNWGISSWILEQPFLLQPTINTNYARLISTSICFLFRLYEGYTTSVSLYVVMTS